MAGETPRELRCDTKMSSKKQRWNGFLSCEGWKDGRKLQVLFFGGTFFLGGGGGGWGDLLVTVFSRLVVGFGMFW